MEALDIWLMHRNYKAHLKLENKITVIVGESATGKSTMSRVILFPNERTRKKISNDKFIVVPVLDEYDFYSHISDDELGQCRLYIIDGGKVNIDDYKVNLIEHVNNSYFIIFSRAEIYDLSYDKNSMKILKTGEDGVTRLCNCKNTYTKIREGEKK